MLSKFLSLYFLYFLFAPLNVKSQNEELRKADSLFRKHAYEECLSYLKKVRPNIEEKFLGSFYLKKGAAYYFLRNYDSALVYYDKTLIEAESIGNLKLLADVHNNIGAVYYRKGEYVKGFNKFEEALNVNKLLKNDTALGISYFNLGLHYKDLFVHEKAIDNLYKAIHSFEKAGLPNYLARGLQSLGNLLREREQYEKSLTFHRQSLRVKDSIGDLHGMYASFNDIGNTYKLLGNYNEALKYFQKVLDSKDTIYLATSLDNIGEIYLEKGALLKAKLYFERSLALRELIYDQKGIAITLAELGDLLLRESKPEVARQYLSRAQLIAEDFSTKDLLLKIYLLQQNMYEQIEDFKSANELGKLHSILQKEMFDDKKERAVEGLIIAYEVENKNKAILMLTQQNSLIEMREKSQRIQKWLYFVLSTLLITLVIIIWKVALRTKKMASWQEQLRLDAQHRNKNFLQVLMSVLNIGSRKFSDPVVQEFMAQNQYRIEAMSIIEMHLSKKDNRLVFVNFTHCLRDLVDKVKIAYYPDNDELKAHFDLDEVQLTMDIAMPLLLIVNELVTNAFKHGLQNTNTPKLNIFLKKKGRELSIEIADNGPGFLFEKALEKPNSSGMKLVRSFSKKLKTNLIFIDGKGTRVRLIIEI